MNINKFNNFVVEHSNYIYIAVIAVLLALLLSNAVRYVVSAPQLPASAADGRQLSDTMQLQTAMSITDRNLFAIETVNEALKAAQSQGTSVAPGAKNWKLTGVLIGADINDSLAIITMDGKDVFVLNMRKPVGGLQLKSVTLNSATFSYSGKEYKLELESGASSKGQTQAANLPSAPITNVQPSSSGSSQFTVNRADVMSQLQDVNSILKNMLVSPHYENNEFAGYRITRMPDDSPLTLLGLQRGDIINRLNGEELSNPQLLFGMLGKVGEIDAVTLDVTRNGQKKTIFVEIQ